MNTVYDARLYACAVWNLDSWIWDCLLFVDLRNVVPSNWLLPWRSMMNCYGTEKYILTDIYGVLNFKSLVLLKVSASQFCRAFIGILNGTCGQIYRCWHNCLYLVLILRLSFLLLEGFGVPVPVCPLLVNFPIDCLEGGTYLLVLGFAPLWCQQPIHPDIALCLPLPYWSMMTLFRYENITLSANFTFISIP